MCLFLRDGGLVWSLPGVTERVNVAGVKENDGVEWWRPRRRQEGGRHACAARHCLLEAILSIIIYYFFIIHVFCGYYLRLGHMLYFLFTGKGDFRGGIMYAKAGDWKWLSSPKPLTDIHFLYCLFLLLFFHLLLDSLLVF